MSGMSWTQQLWQRRWRSLLIGTLVLLLLTFFFAPKRGNELLQGSTYGRAPNGYGAWYQYMEEQGTPIQRWQKPLEQFLSQTSAQDSPTTLLQVGNSPIWSRDESRERQALVHWIAQGNRLVVLGGQGEITLAPFSSQLESPVGKVQIETRRRLLDLDIIPPSLEETIQAHRPLEHQLQLQTVQLQARPLQARPLQARPLQASEDEGGFQPMPDSNSDHELKTIALLADDFGAIAWATGEGDGSRIDVVTADLGANAYQSSPGNFAFLAGLVKAGEAELWVNEYSHGYRDSGDSTAEQAVLWGDYFVRSPLMLIWVQGLVFFLVTIIALNRRWGLIQPLTPPSTNNSEAYMEALAGVLRRSGGVDFVLSQWQAAEQKQLQRQLGLGERPVSLELLLRSWEQQTGESAVALQRVMAPSATGQPSLRMLKQWLQALRQLRQLSHKHFS